MLWSDLLKEFVGRSHLCVHLLHYSNLISILDIEEFLPAICLLLESAVISQVIDCTISLTLKMVPLNLRYRRI